MYTVWCATRVLMESRRGSATICWYTKHEVAAQQFSPGVARETRCVSDAIGQLWSTVAPSRMQKKNTTE